MAPIDCVRTARKLHAKLLQSELPFPEKTRLSRAISGLLFIAEATAFAISNRARLLCLRIKTHAYFCETGRPPTTRAEDLWEAYQELQSLLHETI
jgi:hypothetical protein